MANETVGVLNVVLEADDTPAVNSLKKFEEQMDKVGKGLTDMGKTMSTYVTGSIVAVGTGLTALAMKSTDAMDRIGDLSEITGMSNKALQEWAFVGKVAGASTETVSGAVEGLVRRLPSLQMEADKQKIAFDKLVASGVSVDEALAQVETSGGKASRGLKAIGLSFEEINAMKPDDMINSIMMNLADLKDPLERNAIGASLFGGEWKDIAQILGKGASGIQELKGRASELGTIMSDEAISSSGEFQDSLNELQMQFGGITNELAISLLPILQDSLIPFIQTTVVPAIQGFAQAIGGVFTWFQSLSPQMQGIIVILVGLFAVIGPLLMGLGQFILMISALSKVTIIQTAVTWLLNTAFWANPITWVVAGIIALIAIVWLLIANFDKVSAFLTDLWEAWKTGFKQIVDTVVKVFNDLWTTVSGIFKKIFDGVIYAFVHFNIFSLLNDYILKPFLGFDLFKVGKDVIQGFLDGAGSLLKTIGNFFLNLIPNWIKIPFKLALGIKSPSKVFAGYGENIGLGLVNGMESTVGEIKSMAGSMANVVSDGYSAPKTNDLLSGDILTGGNNNVPLTQVIEVKFGDQIYRTIIDGVNREQRLAGKTLIEV